MKNRQQRAQKKTKAYTSIFLAVILSSCILLSLAMVDVASMHAARSIGGNICAVSGRSVLSEFNTDLFGSYGLFALKDNEDFLKEKFSFYISNSLKTYRSVVHLRLEEIEISAEDYSFDNTELLMSQIIKLSGNLPDYIFDMFSSDLCRLDSSKNKLEIERVICGMKTDDLNKTMIQAELYAAIFALHFGNIMNNLDVPDKDGICPREKYGYDISDEDLQAAVSADAAVLTVNDVKAVNNGEKILFKDNGVESEFGYSDFLRLFLIPVPQKLKLNRMMEIIEININQVNHTAFSFESSCLGFSVDLSIRKEILGPFDGLYKPVIHFEESFVYD